MKKILIDMDDVITNTDWFTAIEQVIEGKMDRSYPGFHLEETLTPEDQKRFIANFDKINFYKLPCFNIYTTILRIFNKNLT